MICYDIHAISIFDPLINGWYNLVYTLMWIAHFKESDPAYMFD